MAERMVAFLRGINVGGKNKVPMAALCELFEAQGCGEAKHYIQSGNVVFRPPARASAAALAQKLTGAFAAEFGFSSPMVLRTATELTAILKRNPFAGGDPKKTAVMLLLDKPAAAKVAALDPARSPGDEFVVHGREIYCKCPNGFARTKLTNDFFDRGLGTTSTGRNITTMEKLAALATAE